MYKYNNIECVNYIPSLHNNVERYNINSDDDNIGQNGNIVKNSKKDRNSKKIEEVLINNITKQINKIESITINKIESIAINKSGRGNNDKKGVNTYKICNPQIGNIKANKKYVGLIFLNNESKSSFITLSRNVYIINYYITIVVNERGGGGGGGGGANYFCSLGIKNSDVNKISIIKGSKNFINIKNSLNNDTIIIKDTIIHEAPINQEICLITDFNKKFNIVEDKSIIKIVVL
jgi:hypothetical protein